MTIVKRTGVTGVFSLIGEVLDGGPFINSHSVAFARAHDRHHHPCMCLLHFFIFWQGLYQIQGGTTPTPLARARATLDNEGKLMLKTF